MRNQPSVEGRRPSPPGRPSSRRTRSGPAPGSRPVALGQAQLDPGQGQPDRARPALAVVGVGDVHDRLGHAVALEHPLAGPLGQALEHGRRAAAPTRTRTAAAGPARRPGARRPGGRTWSAPRRTGSPGGRWRRRGRRRPRSGAGARPTPRPAACRAGRRPRPCMWNSGRARTRRSSAVQRQARRSASALASRLPWAEDGALGRAGGARRVAEQRRVVGPGRVERRRLAVGQVDLGPGDQQVAVRRRAAPSGRAPGRRPRPPPAGRRRRCGPPRAPGRRCWPAPRPGPRAGRRRGPRPGRWRWPR